MPHALAQIAAGKCLTSIGPSGTNNAAVAVSLTRSRDGRSLARTRSPNGDVLVKVVCGAGEHTNLAIGVATERDAAAAGVHRLFYLLNISAPHHCHSLLTMAKARYHRLT